MLPVVSCGDKEKHGARYYSAEYSRVVIITRNHEYDTPIIFKMVQLKLQDARVVHRTYCFSVDF